MTHMNNRIKSVICISILIPEIESANLAIGYTTYLWIESIGIQFENRLNYCYLKFFEVLLVLTKKMLEIRMYF